MGDDSMMDILEAKRDRLQEIKRQTIKYAKRKNWGMVNLLRREEKLLKENIKQIEAIRNKVNKPYSTYTGINNNSTDIFDKF